MTEHWSAAEADFQRFYGLDLRRVCYGASPLGTRRLLSLVRGLPEDSNLNRILNPDADWGYSEELLALLAELVDHGNRLFFASLRTKRQKMPEPIRIPRPGEKLETSKPKAKPTHEEIMRFFGGKN